MRSKRPVETNRCKLVPFLILLSSLHEQCFAQPSFFITLLQFNKLKKRTLSKEGNLIHLHFPRLPGSKFQIIIRNIGCCSCWGNTDFSPVKLHLKKNNTIRVGTTAKDKVKFSLLALLRNKLTFIHHCIVLVVIFCVFFARKLVPQLCIAVECSERVWSKETSFLPLVKIKLWRSFKQHR